MLHSSNGTYDYTLTVTWNGEIITSGVLSQSNNNGDHVYRFYLFFGLDCCVPVSRNHIKRVRGICVIKKFIHFLKFIGPSSAPSFLTVINKTATTITVSWTALDSSDADGYVVNVTSDTDTVQTVQVEGSSNNTITLNGLRVKTTYNITVRAYQQLLGPASSTISVQSLPGIAILDLLCKIFCISSY